MNDFQEADCYVAPQGEISFELIMSNQVLNRHKCALSSSCLMQPIILDALHTCADGETRSTKGME